MGGGCGGRGAHSPGGGEAGGGGTRAPGPPPAGSRVLSGGQTPTRIGAAGLCPSGYTRQAGALAAHWETEDAGTGPPAALSVHIVPEGFHARRHPHCRSQVPRLPRHRSWRGSGPVTQPRAPPVLTWCVTCMEHADPAPPASSPQRAPPSASGEPGTLQRWPETGGRLSPTSAPAGCVAGGRGPVSSEPDATSHRSVELHVP